MLCDRCKKRPAVLFITTMRGQEQKQEGLCLSCAYEANIPQVKDYFEKLGMSKDDLDHMENSMQEALGDMGEDLDMDDDFFGGNSQTFPSFLGNMFSDNPFGGKKDGDADKGKDKDKFKNIKKDRKKKKKEDSFLNNFTTNLSEKASKGELDAIIGREKEIARTIQILSRRQKNNPCLIGEPGVGKTAIAEGIAIKIAEGDVPFHLKNKEIYLLDLTALVAGTQFRGQFESRVKKLISEVKERGNIILFIDEVHTLVSTGGNTEGADNASNLMKPALARGDIQVIGATTFSEYRKYIEKDGALERRFQPVTVNEPTVEETIEILKGIRTYYESFHRVKINGYLLTQCAILSERYITDRFLPDKAIDLLDESCARCAIRSTELMQYDILEQELEILKTTEAELEEAETPDYEKIADVKGQLLSKQNLMDEMKGKLEDIQVTEEDIAKVVEIWTGIPASKIAETEFAKLNLLEKNLSSKIIGQTEAISALTRAIKRSRVQLSKKRRPASFIFVGPTGVGKTELVKVLSEELFDSTEPLIRLDMTEYMEKHSVSRMIGSPPGYVGYDESGQLTEKVRRHPYSVILFDEIEKAHPDVMNLLLQILDEGHIDDAQGRHINFENTVIVMTSNAGSSDQSNGVGFNRTADEINKEKAMKGLRQFLRPEFLGRIDEVVVFNALTMENYEKIAGLMLNEIAEALKESDITLSWDETVLQKIASLSFGKRYGAREVQRVIRTEIEDKIAQEMIDRSGRVSTIRLKMQGDSIQIECE